MNIVGVTFISDFIGQDVNHAVLAVGYGVENGIPYWLFKNSWGESWGDNGYFKMELGKNMCGKFSSGSFYNLYLARVINYVLGTLFSANPTDKTELLQIL